MKRSLSHVGGPTRVIGDPQLGAKLAAALDVEPEERPPLTHGFHTYPARMHYAIARRVLADPGLGVPERSVFDPFCGSGTVLVEALAAGWKSAGLDLNPLASRLARIKTMVRQRQAREAFMASAETVANQVVEDVEARRRVWAPLPRNEVRWYQGHVLRELAALWEAIGKVRNRDNQRALQMVFSSIVVKASRQRSETRPEIEDKSIAPGLCTRWFFNRAQELERAWAELESAAVPGTPFPEIHEGSAVALPKKVAAQSFGLILTSPPYGGTYDYVDHHARRYPWLGVDPMAMRRHELGARRNLERASTHQWEREVASMLKGANKVLAPGGLWIGVVGDGQIGDQRVDAAGQLERIAGRVGLDFVASASQSRPDFVGGPPRREHAVALRRPEA